MAVCRKERVCKGSISMTCEEALKKLYEVIDKEAEEIDVQQVEEH